MPKGCCKHGHQAAANETLLHAFLSWQMKTWDNPGGGGPGDFPMEVKGASILLPAALHHPWGIQNAFHGQLSCTGVAVVSEGMSPRHRMPAPPWLPTPAAG